MEHIEYKFRTEDKLELYAQSWKTETLPRAAICLVHGLGEHSGRYNHMAAFFNSVGYSLLSFDQRGHGKSEGQRGHAPNFDILLDDISIFLDEVTKVYPSIPIFLYGHSLGGNLVIYYALKRKPDISGVIASGPCFHTTFTPPPWKVTLGKIMRSLWPTFSLSNEIELPALSRDNDVVNAYSNDPLVHDRLSAQLGIDLLENGIWNLEHAAELSLPLLVLHGGADRIASSQASEEFLTMAGDKCTLKVWDGFYHEIHNEPEQRGVFTFASKWIDRIINSE